MDNNIGNLFIRADATSAIGTGHIMRCIALAQTCQAHGGKAVFISSCGEALEKRILEEGFDFIPIEKPHPQASDLTQTLDHIGCHSQHTPSNTNNWIVLDGYHFNSRYQRQIKDTGHRFMCIDDYGHVDHYYADLILNQNISADETLYKNREPYTRLLLGTKYVLLRKEFWPWREWKRTIPEIAKNILVTMGGSDPDNVTLKIVNAIKVIDDPSLEVKVIVGPSNPHMAKLRAAVDGSPKVWHLLENVSNMPKIMAWADMAVSAGGSTCWELAYMGLPSLVLSLAENQKPIVENLDNNDAVLNLGPLSSLTSNDIARLINTIIYDEPQRKELSIRCRDIVDGAGKYRVINQMMPENIKLKSATIDDCGLLWDWVNDPVVRCHSFSSDHISWEEHKKWFEKIIKKPDCSLLIAFDYADEPIGQIRFEGKGNDAVVSLSIKKSKRGLGYGSLLIKSGSQKFFKDKLINVIHAYIKTDNISSINSFIKSGFIQNKHDSKNQLPSPNALHYVLERKGVP